MSDPNQDVNLVFLYRNTYFYLSLQLSFEIFLKSILSPFVSNFLNHGLLDTSSFTQSLKSSTFSEERNRPDPKRSVFFFFFH